MGIHIMGTGSYLPEKVLTNQDLEKILDTSDEWIRKRTGVLERRMAAPEEACSDLAVPACNQALDMAGLTAKDIELIIMCTITPDTQCPAAANWLQAKLDAPQALTFDVTAACSGFIFGLNVAEQYLKARTCSRVMVVASEVMTRVVDYTDRTTAILWGDGAGAVILSRGDEDPQILSTHAHTDGANGQNLLVPGGGSQVTPITHESVDKNLHSLKMIEAAASVRVAVRRFVESCHEACQANGATIDDISLFIPHQANLRMLQSVAKRLEVPMERLYVTVEKYGNISSASAPIALDEAVRKGCIKKGDKIILTAFGGGLTWGSALIRW
ncbi:MAG: ketoacyl-ACP synthase III [Deltaproteobacteria bacterium]|nr:ketoacyl-ACP synthase III [Deltaproteobacteria bacterium]